jgi:hypothetical protein
MEAATLMLDAESDELTVILDSLCAGSGSFPAGLVVGGGSTVDAAAAALRPLADRSPGFIVSTTA